MKSLERVIKQKCKFLAVKKDIDGEGDEYCLYGRKDHIPNWIPIYKTPYGITSENSLTLLEEMTSLIVYIFSCLRTNEGSHMNKYVIKLYFRNTNIVLFKGPEFTIRNELASLKCIKKHIDVLTTYGHYMSFHKSFSLRIYFVNYQDYRDIYNEPPHRFYDDFYIQSGDFDYSDNEDVENINYIKTFKSELCTICLERIPNVLFCICGHICICKECNEKKVMKKCLMCKTENTILRII